MQHLDEGTIHTWLDGELPPVEREAAEAHVAQCAECAAAVAEARGFIAASSRILLALDSVPAGVLPAKKGNEAGTFQTPPRITMSRASWLRAGSAIAAVLVLSTVTVIARRSSSDEPLAKLAHGDATGSLRAEAQSEKGSPNAVSAPATSAAPVPPAERGSANAPLREAVDAAGGASAKVVEKRDARVADERKDLQTKKESLDAKRLLADKSTAAIESAEKFPLGESRRTAGAQPQRASEPASEPASDALAGKSASPPAPLPAAPMVAQAPVPALNSVVVTGAGTTTSNVKLGAEIGTVSLLLDSAAPQLLTRNTTNDAGDTVVTTVYNVGGVPVSLIDRSRARENASRIQIRGIRAAPAAKASDAVQPINSLSWSDSTGHTRTLRGAVSRAQLEALKRRLFGATP